MKHQDIVYIKLILIIGLFFCSLSSLKAMDDDKKVDKFKSVEFTRPGMFDFITFGPQTIKKSIDISFSKKALPTWGAILASTALIYYYDEEILSEVQRFGRRIGLGNNDHTRSMISVGKISIFRGPTDTGSMLYFLGDGWMHTMIGSSFLVAGSISNSNRALQTGSQIFHGMIYSTIPNQILKRSFGRESPYRKSKERGAWRPFPSISEYNNNTSKYDAMPTGHLMTATMTFTVIDNNYPEYRKFIRPFAAIWLTALGLQMVNNGVHWASDYPLGIAMGYVYGNIASSYGHKNIKNDDGPASTNFRWNIFPYSYAARFGVHRIYGVNYVCDF